VAGGKSIFLNCRRDGEADLIMGTIRMTTANAIRLAIGLRLIDRSLPPIPPAALKRMPRGAQAIALAANHSEAPSEILDASDALGFERKNAEAFLRKCLHASLEYEPVLSGGLPLPPPPPLPSELYANALGVLA
jgi:hypothetical protein